MGCVLSGGTGVGEEGRGGGVGEEGGGDEEDAEVGSLVAFW